MSIGSFTNRVGYHELNDVKRTRKTGVYFGDEVDESEHVVIVSESSLKSPTLKGDHKHPMAYTREITKVINDDPFSYRQVFKPGSDVLWDLTWQDYLSTKYSTMNMIPPAQYQVWMSNAMDESITLARERLRDPKNRAQLGNAIATAKKTSEEIATNSSNVLYAYRSMKRGNFALAAKHLGLSYRDVFSGKASANAWLQWVYGVQPTLHDVHDACERLHSLNREVGFWFTASAKKQVHHITTPDPNATFEERWLCSGIAKTSYKARITSPVLDSLDTSGVINPLTVAWEIIPYSFVVDWFIPVGNVLESLTATAGLEFGVGYSHARENLLFESSVQHWGGEGTYTLENPGKLSLGMFSFHRGTHSDFALPRLYAKANPFSSVHIANALALIRNTVR